MKLYVKTILIFFFPFIAQSQSIERQFVSSVGNYAENTNGSLSYTVGEPITVLGTDGTKSLLQGFQQPTYSPRTSINSSNSEYDCKFVFYPNPIAEIIHVETLVQGETFEIFDTNGKNYGLFNKLNGNLNVSALSSGIYFIKVNCGTQKAQYHKFIKL